MLKKVKQWFVSGFIVVVLSGCSLLPAEEETLTPPLLEPARESYRTAEVVRDSIAWQVKGVGFFQAVDAEHHQFRGTAGRVASFNVRAGDVVSKGDVLVQLEIDDLDILELQHELDYERAKVNYMDAMQNADVALINLRKLELDIAQLRYNKTREQLASRTLYAGMDGVVIFAENLTPNDFVYDDRVLVSVADVGNLRVHYEVSNPNQISEVQVGMRAEITHRGMNYEGIVVQTPASAPPTTDSNLSMRYSRSLYIELDELPQNVSSGDSADMTITLDERHDTIVIPRMGLRHYMGRDYVHILDGQSRREMDVELGIETATRVEILDGLEEGQLIIMQ